MTISERLIDVYVYSRVGSDLRFLLLKRAPGKIYTGQWRMIGGKVEKNETRWEGAFRELKEETGLTPDRFWSVPTLNHFYDHRSDRIELIPVFAVEVERHNTIRLDDEHTGYEWLSTSEAVKSVYWPEQARIIGLLDELIQNDKILTEWIISDIHT